MVTIGIDPHKRTRTAVAIDTAERVLDERFVGHLQTGAGVVGVGQAPRWR
jgi:hypothetical protein